MSHDIDPFVDFLEGKQMWDATMYEKSDEAGATSVEYAIMCGLIAVVIAGSVATLGGAVAGLFSLLQGQF